MDTDMAQTYYVYIVASKTRRTYIGVTSNLEQRVSQHRTGTYDGHTRQYKKHHLVYFEDFQWVHDAIAREKELKGWLAEESGTRGVNQPGLDGPGCRLVRLMADVCGTRSFAAFRMTVNAARRSGTLHSTARRML
jgi:putative endonuclease